MTQPVQVIGIMAPGVEVPLERGQALGVATNVWTARRLDPAGPFYNNHVNPGIARLAPGATVASVSAELDQLTKQFPAAFPVAYSENFIKNFHTRPYPLKEYVVGGAAQESLDPVRRRRARAADRVRERHQSIPRALRGPAQRIRHPRSIRRRLARYRNRFLPRIGDPHAGRRRGRTRAGLLRHALARRARTIEPSQTGRPAARSGRLRIHHHSCALDSWRSSHSYQFYARTARTPSAHSAMAAGPARPTSNVSASAAFWSSRRSHWRSCSSSVPDYCSNPSIA